MALNTQKATLDPAYLEKLQDYYAEHKVIPSYSVLAALWGVSAKSWVSECVKRFGDAFEQAKNEVDLLQGASEGFDNEAMQAVVESGRL